MKTPAEASGASRVFRVFKRVPSSRNRELAGFPDKLLAGRGVAKRYNLPRYHTAWSSDPFLSLGDAEASTTSRPPLRNVPSGAASNSALASDDANWTTFPRTRKRIPLGIRPDDANLRSVTGQKPLKPLSVGRGRQLRALALFAIVRRRVGRGQQDRGVELLSSFGLTKRGGGLVGCDGRGVQGRRVSAERERPHRRLSPDRVTRRQPACDGLRPLSSSNSDAAGFGRVTATRSSISSLRPV